MAQDKESLQKTLKNEMKAKDKSENKTSFEPGFVDKAKVAYENRDLYLEQIRLKATIVLETLKTAGSIMGAGFNTVISDWNKITTSVAGVTMLALGFYSAKHGTGALARFAESRIRKPTLVQETSRLTLKEALKHPIKTRLLLTNKPKDVLQGVTLHPDLEQKLSEITIATRNTKKTKGVYRNMLLYGPPGTGKTLFVKRLAQHSGMDYAIMTGGDIVAMGREGVTAINEVFDWANSSRRGLLLFVDEADAFLLKRSSDTVDRNIRAAINAFIYRTGSESDKFMLCLASSTPEQLDWAMINQMADVVEFRLPGLAERERMIRHYFDKFVLMPATEGHFKVEQFDYNQVCSDIANLTEGFSGREIVYLASAWQISAYASSDGVLTKAIIIMEVQRSVKRHATLARWQTIEAKNMESSARNIPLSYPKTSSN